MNKRTFSKSLKVALSVLALSWVLFGYYRYLSSPSWEALKDILDQAEAFLVTAGIFDVLLILGLWAASDFLGASLLRILGIRPHAGVERLVMSTATGLSLLSLATTVLTIAHLLYRGAGWTLVGLPAFFWLLSREEFDRLTVVPALRRVYGGKRTGKAASAEQNEQANPSFPGLAGRPIPLGHRLAHGFLLSYISIALGLTLISALAPPLEFDDLAYQLSGPKAYIQKHRLQPLPHNPMTFLPRNVQMLYALGMLLHNEVMAKLIHYWMGLLTMLAAYALGLRLHSRTAGLVATAILASSPMFLWEMRTAHIDIGLALYVFLILYALIIWWSNRDRAWHRLLLWFMGFSLGVKYHALFALGVVTLLVLILHAASTKSSRQAIAATLKFFFLSLIGLFIPWGAANLYFTGNPVFPMFHEVFDSRYWTSELTKLIIHQQKDVGIPLTLENWREWLSIPWRLFISEPELFKGNLGPFCLLFIPLLLFQRRMSQEMKLILCFSSGYGLFWLFTSQHARYLLSVLPGLAVLSGIGLVGWLGSWQGTIARSFARTIATVLAVIAVLNLPFFPNYSNAYYGTSIMGTLPLQYLLGVETRDSYLSRSVENYPIVQFLNELPEPRNVLFWWNTAPSVFYANGRASSLFSTFAPDLLGNDPLELHRVLRENGVTHLVVAQAGQEGHLLTQPEGKFARSHLKRIYRKQGTVLYEFSSEPLNQETIHYDFLGHINEATILMPNEPAGRANSDYRRLTGDGADLRYSLVAFPPAKVEYNLTLCEKPVLEFAVSQATPSCSGKGLFEIWLVEESRKQRHRIYGRELYAEKNPHDRGWFEERLDLGEFGGRQVKILFETTHLEGGRCTWYCWADPVILSLPSE